jgi:hypothetical protein
MFFLNPSWRPHMAKKLNPSELVSFKELLMANSIMADALVQLLIEKELITQEEFFSKLKQVQAENQKEGHA